jgi:hypothetical protein
MNYNISKEIEHQIYDAIDKHLEEYLNGTTFGTRHAREILTKNDFESYFDGKKMSLKDAKKNFNSQKNLKLLISDIKYPGYHLFKKQYLGEDEKDVDQKYRLVVKKILNKIITDRIALEKDKKNNKKIMEHNITKFTQYQMINEMKLPIMKLDEILDEVSKVSNKTLKTVLVTYFKTYLEYIDLTDKSKHIFRINDMSGDILNNNRASFDVIIFDKNDIQQIKMNIIDYSVGEFYTTLPEEVDVFGISMKPSSFINKEELKQVFDGQITDQVTIDIISNVTKFNYLEQFNDFFIWSNK